MSTEKFQAIQKKKSFFIITMRICRFARSWHPSRVSVFPLKRDDDVTWKPRTTYDTLSVVFCQKPCKDLWNSLKFVLLRKLNGRQRARLVFKSGSIPILQTGTTKDSLIRYTRRVPLMPRRVLVSGPKLCKAIIYPAMKWSRSQHWHLEDFLPVS